MQLQYMHTCTFIICFLNYIVKPITTIQTTSNVSKAGGNATFGCIADANPRAMIQWKFNGNLLRNMSDANGIKYLITNETKGNCSVTAAPSQCEASSTLEIFHTQPADSGEYMCVAGNTAGMSTESAQLSVIGK